MAQGALVNVLAAEYSDDQAIARRLDTYRRLFTTVTVSPDSPVRLLVNASRTHDLLVLGYRGRGHGPFGLGRSVLPVVSAARCTPGPAVHGSERRARLGTRQSRPVLVVKS